MYLKALEIQGFKSFPDKTVLTFGEDITAIVGPNGSGKSNISDAIRWVMGEQSTKALRGAKMEDVIFDGTAKRKGLGFAEVSLILDNTTHLFDLEETEVMVTRRYYRSGESEYFINRHAARLRDINELFMDTGLGREGYSNIGQGKIDEILSVRSADRREVFEEAAGISRYRHRKEEAERKLERTEENLVRINDKIDELELQVEPLRNQSEKAKKYLILRDELRGLEISVWLEQLEKIRQSGIKVLSDYETAVRQKETAQAELQSLYDAAESFAAAIREKDLETDQVRFALSRQEADVSELESAIAVIRTQMANNEENTRRIQEELSQQEGRAGSINAQIAQRQQRVAGIEEQMEALRQSMNKTAQEAEEAGRTAGTIADELETLRRKQAMETASAAEAKALLSALTAAAQELYDREETVAKERIEGQERVEQLTQTRDNVKEELERAQEEKDSLANIISGYQLRLDTRERKAREAEEAHRALQMDQNNLQSRIHMLAEMEKLYEGYSKSVKLVMGEADRGNLRGIHGPVAGLLHVADEYAVAIEIALGNAMQNLVVDTDGDAKAAIGYLKRRDGGRCTFLPLGSIRGRTFQDSDVVDEPGFIGLGDELITFDKKYETVFSSLLGGIVIAKDLDKAVSMAKKYGYRFKIVTLDGQVVNPGGSLTGGSVSRSAGILSRANELERLQGQLGELEEKLRRSGKNLEEANREKTAAAYELEAARTQQREHADAVLQLSERLESANRALREGEEHQAGLEAELSQLKARSTQNQDDTQKAQSRIEELEGSAAAIQAQAESKAQGQTQLQQTLAELSRAMADGNAQLAALEGEKAASESALAQLEALHRDIAGDRQQRLDMISEFEEKNKRHLVEIDEKEAQLKAIREGSREKNEAIRRLAEEKLALEGKRNQADRESRDKNSLLQGMEREVSLLEQKKLSAAMEEKQILDKLWDTYELSHEAARAQRVPLENLREATRRIGELKRAISGLGNINLDSIEEYQRVNERYTYFTEQRDDVTGSKKELETIIEDITKEMTTIFAQQFKLIAETFSQVFMELFGGGKGTLELDDPEDILNCGIEIRAQPPGKALKTITLLSGGERAFVAIALYFAILKVRPTPFCVMDEIEAALDENNVVRYARYMRQMSDKTQFIVITHRRGTMEEADILYGVTMQEKGVSRVLTINLNDVERELHLDTAAAAE